MIPQNLHQARPSMLFYWIVYSIMISFCMLDALERKKKLGTFQEVMDSLDSWTILVYKISSVKCLNYE